MPAEPLIHRAEKESDDGACQGNHRSVLWPDGVAEFLPLGYLFMRTMPRLRVALSPPVIYVAKVVLLALVYYGAARLGLQYASIGRSVSLVWPPTGIAFAALTLLGYRYWPGVALGAFLANAATPVPLLAAAGIALGNTFEALVAAHLLRRTAGPRPQLDDHRHVRALLVAAPLGALCAAVIGPMSLLTTGALPAPAVAAAIAAWWAGDVLGGLVVAPVIFTWAVRPRASDNTGRLIEVVVLCLATIGAAELALGRVLDPAVLQQLDYHYLLFPFVIWAALRFGARGASLMTLTVSAVAVVHAVHGGGPFVNATAARTLFSLAGYLGVVAVTGLVLAAAVQWERRQATKALTESEERLRQALDAARMGTWFWSVESNTLSWDDNLRQLYGLGAEDSISTPEDFLERVHPEDQALVAGAVHQVLQDGGDLDHEFRVFLPDGRTRWIADQGEVQRDEEGRPLYMTGVSTDVTERRVAEDRLRQAHRMESLGRLAGGVAHEANNQMSVVLGSADFILGRTDVPEAVRSDVEFIRKAAERTAAVTAQLLAFSRQQILNPEMLDLSAVVGGWEPVLRRVMGEDCGVGFGLTSNLGVVRADPGQLEQVLLNLALNARDAMPRGGRLTVETYRAELSASYVRLKPGTIVRPGEYAVLAVSDTGHGMDKQTLSHIFEPFFTTKGVGRGTGLGLSTVYGIVKQSEGYVWAYSEPGQGTTFKIYLPLRAGTVAPTKVDSAPLRSAARESILVVEDEPPVRHIMKRSLEAAGYTVLEAGTPTEALDVLGRTTERISLLLTDVVMPGDSGRELAERVAELMPGIPVLFTSGYTDGEIVSRGLLGPDAAFIQKPFTPAGLVRAVRERLELASLPRPSGSDGAA
ncbi:MAG TPA: MASE1 domain-containing protein [Gemmatimonadales bacterium]